MVIPGVRPTGMCFRRGFYTSETRQEGGGALDPRIRPSKAPQTKAVLFAGEEEQEFCFSVPALRSHDHSDSASHSCLRLVPMEDPNVL